MVAISNRAGDNLLSYLSDRGPSLDPMVFRNISIAICIISKLSWMEDRHQRSLLSSIEALANQGPEYFVLGLNMMADFVEQMDIPYLSRRFAVFCVANAQWTAQSTARR